VEDGQPGFTTNHRLIAR